MARAKKLYAYKYNKKENNSFKENTIVFIKRSKKYPSGHFLVKTRHGWMDPWINFNTKDSKIDDVKKAKSGFRKNIPDRIIYVVYPLK